MKAGVLLDILYWSAPPNKTYNPYYFCLVIFMLSANREKYTGDGLSDILAKCIKYIGS